MVKGRGGMGNHKHGTSGRAPKSPRLRHAIKLDAERNERKAKKPLPYGSVKDVFEREKPK
jgi:hypothetical protein